MARFKVLRYVLNSAARCRSYVLCKQLTILFFDLIDFNKPLVSHGFDISLFSRLVARFNGACVLTISVKSLTNLSNC